MTEAKQYQLIDHELILTSKKAPVLVRSVMYLFAFLFFLMPIVGLILGLTIGKGMHIGYIIGVFVFSLLGFYLLRIALWNTHGKEIINFKKDEINYLADYGWFKDGRKQIEISGQVEYGTRPLGYEEDNLSGLVISISTGEPIISCVTKLPYAELEELIDQLNNQEESSATQSKSTH